MNDKKYVKKNLVLEPGVQKTFRFSSQTPEQFNVMPRTLKARDVKNLINLNNLMQNFMLNSSILILTHYT